MAGSTRLSEIHHVGTPVPDMPLAKVLQERDFLELG